MEWWVIIIFTSYIRTVALIKFVVYLRESIVLLPLIMSRFNSSSSFFFNTAQFIDCIVSTESKYTMLGPGIKHTITMPPHSRTHTLIYWSIVLYNISMWRKCNLKPHLPTSWWLLLLFSCSTSLANAFFSIVTSAAVEDAVEDALKTLLKAYSHLSLFFFKSSVILYLSQCYFY